jgi:hypothetical protein
MLLNVFSISSHFKAELSKAKAIFDCGIRKNVSEFCELVEKLKFDDNIYVFAVCSLANRSSETNELVPLLDKVF